MVLTGHYNKAKQFLSTTQTWAKSNSIFVLIKHCNAIVHLHTLEANDEVFLVNLQKLRLPLPVLSWHKAELKIP